MNESLEEMIEWGKGILSPLMYFKVAFHLLDTVNPEIQGYVVSVLSKCGKYGDGICYGRRRPEKERFISDLKRLEVGILKVKGV